MKDCSDSAAQAALRDCGWVYAEGAEQFYRESLTHQLVQTSPNLVWDALNSVSKEQKSQILLWKLPSHCATKNAKNINRTQ